MIAARIFGTRWVFVMRLARHYIWTYVVMQFFPSQKRTQWLICAIEPLRFLVSPPPPPPSASPVANLFLPSLDGVFKHITQSLLPINVLFNADQDREILVCSLDIEYATAIKGFTFCVYVSQPPLSTTETSFKLPLFTILPGTLAFK